MNRRSATLLGLRLLRSSGHRRWWSRALVVGGVCMAMVGTLLCIAAATVVSAQADRTWERSFTSAVDDAHSQARVTVSRIAYGERMLLRVDVDPLDGELPLPPGLGRWPASGEVILSPAAEELRSTAAFRALAPGRVAGTVGDAGLRSPDELVIYRGVPASEQPRGGEGVVAPGATGAGAHDRDTPDIPPGQVAALVTVLAVLVGLPVAAFLGVATRLSAATRARRLAVLQFLGASTSTIRSVNMLEVTTLSFIGWLGGVAVFPVVNRVVARSGLLGTTWFASDTELTAATAILPGVLLLTLAVVIGRRIETGTGTRAEIRQADPARTVSAWRLVPLACGLTSLSAQVVTGALRPPGVTPVRLDLLMSTAVVVTAAGLAVAMPSVIRWSGRVLAVHGKTVSARLGGARAAFDPRDGARLVVALALLVMAAGVTIGQTRDARAVSVPTAAVVPVAVDVSELPDGGAATLLDELPTAAIGLAASDPASPEMRLAAIAPCDRVDAFLRAVGGASVPGCVDGAVLTSSIDEDPSSVRVDDVPAIASLAENLPHRGVLPENVAGLLAESGVDLLVTIDPAALLDAVARGPVVTEAGGTAYATNVQLVTAVPSADVAATLASIYRTAPYSQPTATGLDPDSGRNIAMINGFVRLGLLLGTVMTVLALAVALADRATTRRRPDMSLLAAGVDASTLRAAHRWESLTTLGTGASLALLCGVLGGLAWQYAGGLVREPDWASIAVLAALTVAAVVGVAVTTAAMAPRDVDIESLRTT